MKTLISIILFVSLCFSRSIDSCGVFPFGPDFDLRKDLTVKDVIEKFGEPIKIDTIKSDLYMHYPNMVCYIFAHRLYNIEIKEGKFQNLKIGMSKRKILKVYGPSVIVDSFPDNSEIQEFGYYDDQWVRYIVTLFLNNDTLSKISIRKEDDWL